MKRFTPGPMAPETGAVARDGAAGRRVLPCMTVRRTLPCSLPIDCAACTISTLGDRHRLAIVEIDGGLYAFHPTCLRPSRVRRADARPLAAEELAQLGRDGSDAPSSRRAARVEHPTA